LMDWKSLRRVGLYALLFVLYLVSTVPVGLFLYSMKTAVGIDIFTEGGFHTYMRCLSTSFPLSRPRARQSSTSGLPVLYPLHWMDQHDYVEREIVPDQVEQRQLRPDQQRDGQQDWQARSEEKANHH